eukprot:jgi/Bigna1/77095/fgenesh1_pg.45_\
MSSRRAWERLLGMFDRNAISCLVPTPQKNRSSVCIHVTSAVNDGTCFRTIKVVLLSYRRIQSLTISTPLIMCSQINESSPESATDFFILNACRAAADYVVTTGEILREEHDLNTDIQGQHAEDLAAWRRELGKTEPQPTTVVMTNSSELDFEHPLFLQEGRKRMIYTSESTYATLQRRRIDPSIDFLVSNAPSLQGLIHELQNQHKDASPCTISVEAGPTTSSTVYAGGDIEDGDMGSPDLLFLSEYRNSLRSTQILMDKPALDANVLSSSMTLASTYDDPEEDFIFHLYVKGLDPAGR